MAESPPSSKTDASHQTIINSCAPPSTGSGTVMDTEIEPYEPLNVVNFKSWLVEHGADIHPDAHFEQSEQTPRPLCPTCNELKKSTNCVNSGQRIQYLSRERHTRRRRHCVNPIFFGYHTGRLEGCAAGDAEGLRRCDARRVGQLERAAVDLHIPLHALDCR